MKQTVTDPKIEIIFRSFLALDQGCTIDSIVQSRTPEVLHDLQTDLCFSFSHPEHEPLIYDSSSYVLINQFHYLQFRAAQDALAFLRERYSQHRLKIRALETVYTANQMY